MSPNPSLKARLVAGSIAWIIVVLLAAAVLLSAFFRSHAQSQFEQQLGGHLDQLLANIENVDGTPVLAKPMSDPRFARPYSGIYWQVDGQARGLLRSRSLWDYVLKLPDDRPADGELHRHIVAGPAGQRLLAVERKVSLPGERLFLRAAVAGDLGPIDAAQRSFHRLVIVALAFLGIGLALLVALQVWAGLRPLRGLGQQLGAVRAGRTAKLEGRYPREIQPLVDELNALIDYSAAVVARGRAEAGTLAHGLKTPLAVLANAVGDLARERGGGAGAADVQAQIATLRRQIDFALARARAAASVGVLGSAVAVEGRIREVVAAMQVLHRDREIVLLAPDEHLVAQVETQDFDEILGNLLDNACKWARRRVEVSARPKARRVEISIEDDGPGLPPDRRVEVFRRGHRLDEAVPGSGLGLAIVRDLVERYGGAIRLDDSRLGGLCATVELPRAGGSNTPPAKLAQSSSSSPYQP